MERSCIYSYVGNLLKWLFDVNIRPNDIEAARKWQLELYHSGKFGNLMGTEESLLRYELQKLSKQDLICRVIQLEKHATRKATIQLLPKKTIQEILSWLPLQDLANASKVCKRWRQIASYGFVWNTVTFTNERICDGTIDCLLARGTKELIVDNCVYFSPTFKESSAAEYVLESLTLDTNVRHETSQHLLSILMRCRRLKHIDLTSVNVNDEICLQISKNVELQSLTLHAHSSNLNNGILLIAQSCKRLRTLNFYNHCEPLSEEEISELINSLPSSIQILDVFSLQVSLRDRHVALLVTKCPNITALNLRGCIKISVETIVHLRQLSELQHLNVAWCFGKINEWQRSSRSRSKFLYIGVPFVDSLEKLEESATTVKEEIMRILPGVEITIQP